MLHAPGWKRARLEEGQLHAKARVRVSRRRGEDQGVRDYREGDDSRADRIEVAGGEGRRGCRGRGAGIRRKAGATSRRSGAKGQAAGVANGGGYR